MALTGRVFIYGMNYAPELIGVGRYTGEIGAYLATAGCRIDVITAVPHYPGWSVRDGYSNWFSVKRDHGQRVTRCPIILKKEMRGIWRLIAPLSFAIFSLPILLWRMLTVRPDVVFCVEPTLFAAPAALILAKLVGSRSVLHVQDLEVDAAFAVGHLGNNRFKAIAHGFERLVLRGFDSVVTISRRMRDQLAAKGVEPKKLHVIRNWVDLDKIKPLNRLSTFRAELAVAESAFVALYAGNIGAKQALHLLFEAAVRLKDNPAILFAIAGEGPEKAALLSRYGGLPNVRFLPLQPEEKLCELLGFADVHLLPQLEGTADLVLPSKLGGMLASGKACIVMAEPGTELHSFLGDSVRVIPPGDSDELAEAILAASRADGEAGTEPRLTLANSLRSETNLDAMSRLILGRDLTEADVR